MVATKAVILGANARNAWRVDASGADLVRATRSALPAKLAAEPKDCMIDLARTAMVVIDMQNDFCHPKGWLASIGVDFEVGRYAIFKTHLAAFRNRGILHLFDQRCELHGLRIEFEFACFDLRQVEHLIDETKEMGPGAVHTLQRLHRIFRAEAGRVRDHHFG